MTPKGNLWKFYVRGALYSTALSLVNGAILQKFLLNAGVDEGRVGVLSSVLLIVQVAAMLGFSWLIERLHSIIRLSATLSLFLLPLFGVMIYYTFLPETLPADVFYPLMLGIAGVCNVALGIYNVLSYKLPYHIMDMTKYGRIMAISGIVLGVCGMGFSALLTFMLGTDFGYLTVMRYFLFFGAALMAASSLIGFSFHDTGLHPATERRRKINLFTYKPFYLLIFPNLARGFFNGVYVLAATVGVKCAGLDDMTTAATVTILNAVTLGGCFFFSVFIKGRRNALFILLSSLVAAVALPMTVVSGNPVAFLVLYGVMAFFVTLVDYGVPVAVVDLVAYDVMGQYSSWRMALHTLGTALGGLVIFPLIDAIGAVPALFLVGACLFLCGVSYFIFLCRTRRLISEGEVGMVKHETEDETESPSGDINP